MLNKSDLLDAGTFAARRGGPARGTPTGRGGCTKYRPSMARVPARCGDMMVYLEERRAAEMAEPELAEAERRMQLAMQDEARQRVEEYRAAARRARARMATMTLVMTTMILMTTMMSRWCMRPEPPPCLIAMKSPTPGVGWSRSAARC